MKKIYKVRYKGKVIHFTKIIGIARWTGIPYETIKNWLCRGQKPRKHKISIKRINIGESYEEADD